MVTVVAAEIKTIGTESQSALLGKGRYAPEQNHGTSLVVGF